MDTDEKWSVASICIVSELLPPDKISGILNIRESRSYEKGASVSLRNPGGPKRSEHLWILESGLDSSEPLDCHIAKLAGIIDEKLQFFNELLPYCSIEISCGFSSGNGQGGFVIESDLLKRLTVIPLDIILDLYPPG